MNACSVDLPGGVNGDCQLPLSEIKNILICDKDVSFTDAEVKVLSNWEAAINEDLEIYAVAGLVNYTPTTDDPNIITNPVSKAKTITNSPVPSFEFMLDSNFCDFKSMLQTLKGGVYGVFFELHNGNIQGYVDQSGNDIGSFKPYKARINAYTKGAQEIDSNEAFKLYVNFLNANELQNQYYFAPIWGVDELLDAMPVGVNVIKTGAYASGDQEVRITTRCADAITGLVVGDFETSSTKSNVSTPAVTSVSDDGGGVYTLTVQKDSTPANIVDGDYVYLRVAKKTGDVYNYVSNWIRVEGVTA